MPALSPSRLVETILAAFTDSGCQGQLCSPLRTHPRKFLVVQAEQAMSLWIYIWTITHGGATRSPEEYRIQLTTVTPPLALNPNGPTLLLGWNPENSVFTGFDITRHRTGFRPGSNSVQVSLSALLNARNFGWGFYTNQYDEIAVSFRPSELLNYARNAPLLHADGARAVKLLERIVSMNRVSEAEVAALPAKRQKIVETITRFARTGNFRDKVSAAYENRCAVTRVQLKLVDAAHILPVGAEGSTDSVRNGLLLSPTYHRAFDHGLIYLTSDMKMTLNQAKADRLTALNLADGIAEFCQQLNKPIFLPADVHSRPALDYIRKANQFRRIELPN